MDGDLLQFVITNVKQSRWHV